MSATPDPQTVIATSLESLLAAAALHLGEATAEGARLAGPDPQEAWRALLAADAMIQALDRLVHPAFKAETSRLAALLAARRPALALPVPASLTEDRS
ncbi:MAG: hypothetical protein ACLGIN_02200 [Candidatus Sericytochromatia bacterium]